MIFIAASEILPAIHKVAFKSEPKKLENLRLLITKHLELLDQSQKYFEEKKDSETVVIQLLSTAAIQHTVTFSIPIHFC